MPAAGLTLVQFRDPGGAPAVAVRRSGEPAWRLRRFDSVLPLAQSAILAGRTLAEALSDEEPGDPVDLLAALAENRLRPAIGHPDSARLIVTGTGLTHLGSAESRDTMHRAAADGAPLTDSMKMFLMGVEGGKPAPGAIGVQPEWFYKGDGSTLVGPGDPLPSPGFALDAGEEPEIAGIYLIGPDGTPFRLGFALGNEFSDHVTEQGNYLWLAHSKLRHAAIGAELLTGALPGEVRGTARIRRGNHMLWEKPFRSGEEAMSHSIANLEQHHFKYARFRRPGDVHVHFFGTATASFADGIRTRDGDIFEIEAEPFALPLVNPLAILPDEPVQVRAL